MKKVLIFYEGWGERWLLGTVAHNGQQLLFEYSPEAIRQQLELSPHQLKLKREAYGNFPAYMQSLPGLVNDSLPDGWGILLMDKIFRKQGRNPLTLSPLDRLMFVGNRGMGALTFEPSDSNELSVEDVLLLDLARESKALVNGLDSEALQRLALMGGSPHGARPKVLVYYNPDSRALSSDALEGGTPWLVKFQAQNEHKEMCAVEHVYARLAHASGLNMPQTAHFDLDAGLAAFGVQRFDVEDGMRVPIHSLAGALHADFRALGSVDYLTFLRFTRLMTRDERFVREAYARCLFNVLFNNRDDHSKNFSFRLNQQRHWELAPCYDLTFNEGPGGEHQMDVLGYGQRITRHHLIELAKKSNLDPSFAEGTLERMLGVADRFNDVLFLSGMQDDIRPATLRKIQSVIKENARLLGL